jgi:hypothetical protein
MIQRHRSRGVLVDTNILLLYFVGTYDRDLIARFKRTRDRFIGKDYDLLSKFLGGFKHIVTTPHILAEVNSLSAQMGDPGKTDYFATFAKNLAALSEHYVVSATAAKMEAFPKLGLTDSGIMHLAATPFLVLTDDFRLYGFLERSGVDVVNFNHLRLQAWVR